MGPSSSRNRIVARAAGATLDRATAMAWSLAHRAVEREDLPLLRELLDAGQDVEETMGIDRIPPAHVGAA